MPLFVCAHPDDETIGAGARLCRMPDLAILHITDGAPLDMKDALAHGFHTREQYAAARRSELGDALREGGASHAELAALPVPDQRACFCLLEIVEAIRAAARKWETVWTHPYEGGHPDHDACAFAVHTAARLDGFQVMEFSSYHAGPHGIETNSFLESGETVHTSVLSSEDRDRKSRMFQQFHTQRAVLEMFSCDAERWRRAPQYDFSAPPHPGRLHYEQYDWGMTGEGFCRLAAAAQASLGL